MALARFENIVVQLEGTTTKGMMGFVQPTPATPVRLFVSAAATPATPVPCPELHPVSEVFEVPVRKFQPGISFGFRSGWFGSAPESMMSMGILVEPSVTFQAFAAWIVVKCHCDSKSGSFGVVVVCAMKSRSTQL